MPRHKKDGQVSSVKKCTNPYLGSKWCHVDDVKGKNISYGTDNTVPKFGGPPTKGGNVGVTPAGKKNQSFFSLTVFVLRTCVLSLLSRTMYYAVKAAYYSHSK